MGYLLTFFCRLFENLLLGASSHLTLSTGGIMFLASPVFFTAGPYALVLTQKTTGSFILGLGASLLISLILGFIFVAAHRRLSYDSYAVFTLASVLAFDALLKSWDGLTGGVLGIAGIPRPAFFQSLSEIFFLQLMIALVFLGFYYLLFSTRLGRQIRALRENKAALDSLGVSNEGIAAKTLLIAGFLATVSGLMAVWRIQFLDPTYGGIPLLIQGITIAILAYQKQWKGFVISTALVTALPEILRLIHFPSALLGQARIVLYSVLIILLLYRLAKKENSSLRPL